MTRFTPTRAGIINLWDYRDEEFVFADGWLVLRGPNGSGKTKALEVLFPFVLDGRIEPRRLNPFASEERTMKSNLLYRGQESALAYVWLEFSDGTDHVTVGAGLRAQKHSDKVTRWYFVTGGRVGVDFALLDEEDRPLVRKHLATQLGADAIRDNAEEHRAAVDARLFGLGAQRYEQLLNLVLTLRKPQLAKHLDPVSLSQTLADGLRPLDDDLLVEAARSFDDMESVQQTLSGLIAADEATKSFLSIYTTYLRTRAKADAEKVSGRRGQSDACAAALRDARTVYGAAQAALETAKARLETAEPEPARLRAHQERLKLSDVYQSLGQLEDLQRVVRGLADAVRQAEQAHNRQHELVQRRRDELSSAQQQLTDRRTELSVASRSLAQAAEAAGIGWSAADAEADDLAARVTGRATARRDDVAVVRRAVARLEQAKRERERTALAAEKAAEAVEQAITAERAAAEAVGAARRSAADALSGWLALHAELLATLQLAEARPDLEAALEAAGEPDAPGLPAVFGRLAEPALQRLRDERARLHTQLAEAEVEIERVTAERERIAAERDDAPAPWPARPAARDGRAGAPLWRLVRFADDVAEEAAAGIEAALEAANLLDAWVAPSDQHDLDGDGYLRPLPEAGRPDGPTLAEVLRPEEQDDVAVERVQALLESISLGSSDAGLSDADQRAPQVDQAGRFALSILIGGYRKPEPEFIGATARARRRAQRIAECDRRLAELTGTQAGLRDTISDLESTLETARLAERALPPLKPIITALAEQQQRAVLLRAAQEHADAARVQHDTALAEVNAAEQLARRASAERALPGDQVDTVAAAVGQFERHGDQVGGARRACAGAENDVIAAQRRATEAVEVANGTEQALDEQRRRHDAEAEAVRTLQATIKNPDAQAILDDIKETGIAIEQAEAAVTQAREQHVGAAQAVAAAERDVGSRERELQTAIRELHAEAGLLAPYAHPDLLELLRCPAELRWPARRDDWGDGLPGEVAALHEAILAATKDLAPTESSLKQAETRMLRALEQLHTQLGAAGQDYRPEHNRDGEVMVVQVADEDGYAPVKVFADRIAGHRHDQELLLTEAERRILEDTLLGSLARQIHQRTIDARDLVEAMDHEMRQRRMSSGLTVGVGWQLADDLDEDQRQVCKLLERDPARLSPAHLVTIRQHFAARIKSARATYPAKSYRELLAEVLDYRRWRVFAFRLHRPGRSPEALTRARHSQLSGGEQSVSLHLPLFAAAHALFTSARPGCPRLLGLDEAFAGVDETGRGELMALAGQFDLDLFMTGYDLFATHETVSGCAHFDLSHAPGEHLVSPMLMVWDGKEALADFDGTLAAALGSPGTRGNGFQTSTASAAALPDAPTESPDAPANEIPADVLI